LAVVYYTPFAKALHQADATDHPTPDARLLGQNIAIIIRSFDNQENWG